MADTLEVGARALSIEDVARVARGDASVHLDSLARARIGKGRDRLSERIAHGERIYGVNTGVGGNQGFALRPDEMERLQHNLLRQLSCATGEALPRDVVRAAMLLRIATFATGASAVRPELVDVLIAVLNRGVV